MRKTALIDHEKHRHHLSPLGRDIAEAFGLDAALAFAKHFGGRYISIPVKSGPSAELRQALGDATANAFCRRYAGSLLWPSKEARYLRAIRLMEMQAMQRSGASLAEIALRYGITVRQVSRLLGPRDAQPKKQQRRTPANGVADPQGYRSTAMA